MIQVENLTKKYGKTVAVDNLSFSLTPGKVTGFLGPNGSGKSTAMRCIVGLDKPNSGRATICGQEYSKLRSPLTTVGALLDGKAFHPGRTARTHLKMMAQTHGIPTKRVDEVLHLTGISGVANKKVKSFSLGMAQRLGIAAALLGDPQVLLFDEPINGLDPEGVRWVRQMCQYLASQGRTIFISSHLMAEMAMTAQEIVIIGQGRLIDSGPIEKFTQNVNYSHVRVVTPQPQAALEALQQAGINATIQVIPGQPVGVLLAQSANSQQIGELLSARAIPVYELTTLHRSLEDIFMDVTSHAQTYTSGNQAGGRA